MSFIGASLYYLDGIRCEKETIRIEATRWVFDTGIQDEEHLSGSKISITPYDEKC
jgi:hypothetical protein